MGRPSKYDEEYHPAQAYKFSLAGLTDKQMAEIFEIAESTLNDWKLKHPIFSESLKRGKEEADSNVATSLYKRAVGHKEKVKKAFKVRAYDDNGSLVDKIEVVEVEEYYPPEVIAQIFWLKNRHPDKWRDKRDVTVEGKTKVDYSVLSDEALDELEKAVKASQ
ncbi:terminase [Ornithobacterium rhinotracheale]|uniref:terminase n=1 Tax=Ornithobacterium rhinotracheale TaxID=28251 RepID=UPI0030B89D52